MRSQRRIGSLVGNLRSEEQAKSQETPSPWQGRAMAVAKDQGGHSKSQKTPSPWKRRKK